MDRIGTAQQDDVSLAEDAMGVVDTSSGWPDIAGMSTSSQTSPVNADWFRQQLEQKRLSQRKLAKFMEIDPSAVTLLLQGKRRMQMDEAAAIARFLGVSVEDVLKNAGLSLSSEAGWRVPLLGSVDHEDRVEIGEQADGRTVEAPSKVPNGTVAVRIADRSNKLFGALVFFRPQESIDPGAIGRNSVVRTTSGDLYMAHVSPGTEPGLYDLQLTHSRLEDVPLAAASPVLWIRP